MNEDILKKLYENASSVFSMPNYDQFVLDMQDDAKLERFRQNMSKHYSMPEFDKLKSDLGIVKKKEDTDLPSGDGLSEPQESWSDQLINQLKLGSVELGEAIASTPETLYRLASVPQNFLADILDVPELKTSPEKFGEFVGVKNKILDFYEKEGEKLSSEVELYSLKNYEKQGIIESFQAGNYSDGFAQLSEGLVRSAPFSLSIMAGGAATSLPRLSAGSTLVFMGPEIKEQEEKGKSEIEAIGNAFTIAAAETVFSSIGSGTIGNVYKDIILKEGIDQGKEIFRRGLIDMYKSALKKYGIAAGALGEGIEEVSTSITQNLANGLPAFENVGDAFIQGVAGGGVYTAPISASNARNFVQSEIAKSKVNKILDGTDYTDVLEVLKDAKNVDDATVEVVKTKNSDKLFSREVKNKVDSGEITKEEASGLIKNFNLTKAVVNKVDLLENVSDDSKKKIASLLIERSDLQRKIETIDDASLSKLDIDKMKEINDNISILSSGGTIETEQATTAEPIVEPTEGPIVTQPTPQTVSEVLNRPVTLTQLGGSVLETPIEGDLYVEGQQVVLEDADGNLTEIGNVDEISDSTLQEIGIDIAEPSVKPMTDGNLMYNDKVLLSDKKGIKKNKRGEISRVTLREQDGAFVTLRGANAEEAAYQILLREAQSPEQAEFINQQLEQDEQFQNELRQVAEPTEAEAAPDLGQTIEQEIDTESLVQDQAEIETEVQKLSNILKAPDVRAQVSNAVRSLNRVVPDVQFVVYETQEEYTAATGNTASGSFDPNTKIVSINASSATPTTVAHETFHAIVTGLVKTDAEAKSLTDRMIKAVSKVAPFELQQYLNEFAADYDNNIQSEEKLAELVGRIANNYETLPTNTQSTIKKWLDALAKFVGLKPFTDAEVIDVLNTISGKIATGEEIAFEDINVLGDPNTIGGKMSTRFQANFSDKLSGLTFRYDANTDRFKNLEETGFITKDKKLSDFNGDIILLHQPDAAFAGTILKGDEVIVEGKGGMFYPIKFHEDGYFWASTARVADKMAADLNKVYDQNNGRILMALTSAPYNKLLSSTTMSNAVLDFFTSKAVDSRFKLKKGDVRTAIIQAANKTIEINDRKTGLGIGLKKSETFDNVLSAVKENLSTDNSTFADRKTFVDALISQMAEAINSNDVAVKQFGQIFSTGIRNKYFKGITKTGKIRISATNMTQAISEMFTEPILKEGVERTSGGQVYAILEMNGRVEAVDSDKHESYPKAIRSAEGQKTVLHILQDRLNWNDTFEDFQTGEIVEKNREMRVYPTTGVSVQGLRLNVREQKSSLLGIIRTAKNNGISDQAILKYLRDNNLDVDEGFEIIDRINQEEMRARQKAEGLFDPDKKVVPRFLDTVYKTLMSGRGYRPKSMQTLSEYREGAIEAEIQIARRNVKKIEQAIKKQSDPKATVEAVDRFMRGETDHGVPDSMIDTVSTMRTHLDNLSKILVDSGVVESQESKDNIINNLGSYLNRSYKLYDDKNYAKKVSEEVKQAAKNKLREIYRDKAEQESIETGVPVEAILKRRVDAAIDQILNQNEANEFVMRSREGSKNLTPLEQRKEIPAEIRALMGEYGDPAMNYVKSIAKVSALIANQNFQKQLRSAGEGTFLFTEPTGIYNTKIAGETSESMDILAGMYTSKDIAKAMENGGIINLDFGKFQPIYDFYLKSVGSVKYTKTILSIGTHAKNIIGNVPFMIMTGNLNFSAFNSAIQTLRAEYSKNGKPELLAKMDEYTRLGIINQSTTLNEIRDLLSSGKTFEDVMIERTSAKPKSRVVKGIKSLFRGAQKTYQVEDDFFKIAAYESEKVKYAKALFNKGVDQLTETELKEVSDRAAAIVKNVLPNYGRVGGYVKLLKALPIAGTFISFTSESVRTSYNTVDLTFKEIADPKTRAIGLQRLGSIMLLVAAKASLIAALNMNLPEDEEDEIIENARLFLPFWDKNSTIGISDIKDGTFKYRSVSASDPHGYMTRVINAYLNSENFREGLIKSVAEAAEPWTNPDITFNALRELISNRDQNGRQIFKEGDTSEEILEKILSRLWKTAEPGTITSGRKIAKSENPGNEAIGQFTGFKEHNVDVIESIGYLSSDLQKRALEAGSDYSRAKREYERGEITIENLRERYDAANEKKKKVYEEAIKLYRGALYFGSDPAKIQQRMMDWGIPKYVMIGIVRGEIPNMNR